MMGEDWAKVLTAIAPKASPAFVTAAAPVIEGILARYECNTPLRAAHLLGHCALECQGFTVFAENLNYSAARLVQVWPSRFPTAAVAAPYARNPRALALKVYNGRMGNRVGSDDGWNFRGSGMLQHTGRDEFKRVKARTGLDVVAVPDQLRDPRAVAAMLAGAASYFVDRKVTAPADRDDITASTRAINGGTTGLADRKIYIERAKRALVTGGVIFDARATADVMVSHPTADTATTDEKRRTTEAAAQGAVAVGPTAGAGAAGAAHVTGAPLAGVVAIFLGLALLGGVAFMVLRNRAKRLEPIPNFVQRLQENSNAASQPPGV